MELDFKKLSSDEHVSVWIGPSGGSTLGVTKAGEPLANELNNTGGTSGMIPASQSISWNDTEIVGVTDSEELNEPSLADSSTFVEFGPTNLGGSVSYFLPREYDDNSNEHSLIYDLTEGMRETLDFAVRLDGEKKTTVPAADGDYVSITRAMSMSESNPFTPGESTRRTVNYAGKGDFARYTVVGTHTITAVKPKNSPWAAGKKARLRAEVQGRDYTNALRFSSSDVEVVNIYPGGFYEVTGTAGGAATITISDEDAGTSTTVAVTVA